MGPSLLSGCHGYHHHHHLNLTSNLSNSFTGALRDCLDVIVFMVSMEAPKWQESCPSSHSGARQVGSDLRFRQRLGEGRPGNIPDGEKHPIT